jgi:hypothetical protein
MCGEGGAHKGHLDVLTVWGRAQMWVSLPDGDWLVPLKGATQLVAEDA